MLTPSRCWHSSPDGVLKGVSVVQILKSFSVINLGNAGGGIVGWLLTFSMMISIVFTTGTLVNRLSTSREASVSEYSTIFTISMKSYVDSIANIFLACTVLLYY